MKIGVLAPAPGAIDSAVENYLVLQALRGLLSDHSLTVLDENSASDFDLYITLGNRFLADGFWDEWLLAKPQRVAALCLSVDGTMAWDARKTEKLRQIANSGKVSVVDETSYRKVKEVLASTAVTLGGNIALFSYESSLRLSTPAHVFSPGVADPAFSGKSKGTLRRLMRRFYRRINRKNRALFLAHEAAHFDWGANAGAGTLFDPLHPQMHLKAIASAASVVAFSPTVLMAAVACGVPAILLGNDPISTQAVEAAGIPFLQINPNTDPAELEHRAEAVIRKYPWETVREKSGRLKETLLAHLKELGLKPKEPKRKTGPKAVAPEPEPLHVATIVGREDLPRFAGLFENLSQVSMQDVHFHVLALDRATELAIQKMFATHSVYLYRSSELWQHSDRTLLFGPSERRAALLKPRFLSMLVKKCAGPVLFCDPGLFFFRSPAELFSSMDGGETLLFPRWCDSLTETNQSAIYDVTLLVATSKSEPLLKWWAESVVCACTQLPTESLQTNPRFLSLAPVLFPTARVYRQADHNVHVEGARTLGVSHATFSADPFLLHDHRPIGSVQGAFKDARFEIKGVWDQISRFFLGLSLPSDSNLEHGVRLQQRRYWRDLEALLWAYTLFQRNFPWAPTMPPSRLLRSGLSGVVRWGVRVGLAIAQTASGKPRVVLTDGSRGDWPEQLRAPVFASFQLAASKSESPEPEAAAASA